MNAQNIKLIHDGPIKMAASQPMKNALYVGGEYWTYEDLEGVAQKWSSTLLLNLRKFS